MNSPIFEEYWPMTYAAHKKWQRSHQVTPPTSDGTPPPNEGEKMGKPKQMQMRKKTNHAPYSAAMVPKLSSRVAA